MRGIPARKRAAFALYGGFGIGLIAVAIVASSIVFAGVGAVCIGVAVVAVRSFPHDRDW